MRAVLRATGAKIPLLKKTKFLPIMQVVKVVPMEEAVEVT